MQWNPYLNALIAAGYIGAVVSAMAFISSLRHDTPDTIFDMMGVLSLLVLSAATMAFLFFYRPVTLLLDNKRDEAVGYFLKMLGTFAVLTVLAIVAVSLQ